MIDRVAIHVQAGDGGDGVVSFRREKFVPRGGPDGGDGGRGGSVYLVVDGRMRTLAEFRRRRAFQAKRGGAGEGNKRHGRNGADLVVRVPVGTIVREADPEVEGELLGDLTEVGQRLLVARGGRGGKGNVHFATSTNRAPHIAEKGGRGGEADLVLDLKLLSDVGIVGVPNVGKSTLLRAVSAAHPKVADYPFTTLEPILGVAEIGYETLVIADIPGLIEGAHSGAGLGLDFLRHVERTRVLIHVVDGSRPDPQADVATINAELAAHSTQLAAKRQVLAVNKLDLPEVRERRSALGASLEKDRVEPVFISAATGEGVPELLRLVLAAVAEEERKPPAAVEPVVLRPAPRRPRFVITKREGAYEVEGDMVSALVEKLGLDSSEARFEVWRRLKRLGVSAALARLGARPGDQVVLGGVETEWEG